MNYDFLKELSMTHAVTGDTYQIKNLLEKELKKLNIEFFKDGYGSIIIGDYKNAKVMILAHIDEVGFQITKINDNGTINILPVGWVFPNRLDHNSIYIQSNKGMVKGGIFHKDYLKSENILSFASLFCDVGATSKDEVEDMGIKIGQTGSFKKDYWENNGTIFASSIDNKVSIYAILEAVKHNRKVLENTLIVFHNDEEMQDHSANSIGYQFPIEYCIVMDYCPVHQKFDEEDVFPDTNQGPMIFYRGGSHIIHEDLRIKLDKLTNINKAFISEKTLPGLEPQNFQNNGTTKAFNYCIPAIGYHGQIYSVKKKDIELFSTNLILIKEVLLN